MIYLKLFITFLKIGFFSFGGGYVMIPLIQKEITENHWLSTSEFADIIAIAEMTPGPIAVNSATFVGYKIAGLLGGLTATAGVAMPSLILVFIISNFFFKFQKHPLNKALFYGIRPVIVGLITTAALFVAETALFRIEPGQNLLNVIVHKPFSVINIGGIAIMAASITAIAKFKLHPVIAIIASGAVGAVLFTIIPF